MSNFLTATTKKVANNTIYQLIGKAISMTITVVAVMIITRVYGREGYGEFSLMQSWPALFFVIVDFGVNAIAARELSKDFTNANKYIGNIILMRLLNSAIIIFLLYIALSFFPYSTGLKLGIRLALFLLPIQSLYSATNVVFQVKLRYDYSNISYVLGYLIIFSLILILSYLKVDVMWINLSYGLGGIFTFFLSLRFMKKLGVVPDFSIDKALWKYLYIQALPLGIMFIFSQISFKEDAIMLSLLKLPAEYGLNNTESVAVYALPYKIFDVALVVPAFFMNAVYPIFVRKMEKDKKALKNMFFKALSFLSLAGLLAGFMGIIFANQIIGILGGADFAQSINVLRILFAGLFVFYLTSPISWLIVTLGDQKKLPWIYLASAVLNFVCNFIFIPKYSFYAATVITQASELLILVLLSFAAYKSWKKKYGTN